MARQSVGDGIVVDPFDEPEMTVGIESGRRIDGSCGNRNLTYFLSFPLYSSTVFWTEQRAEA
jgi:hypothetical protein